MHILVTGANGQVGREFQDAAANFPDFNFTFASREILAIEDEKAVQSFFKENSVDVCINCAAYTAVDKAEDDRENAILINATAVGLLAKICKENNATFFHISTDYVFDGMASLPYNPDHKTNPVNFYGETKLMGEKAALAANPASVIIRTSWVYSRHGKNFVKTMMNLLTSKPEISVVNDQSGSPTHAADLAEAILQILVADNVQPGIYHFCNAGVITWFDFTSQIKILIKSDCKINAVSTSQYPTPAARPTYSALDCNSFTTTFGIGMKPWDESLEKAVVSMINA